MAARYETHLLIDELQREKMLETQAKQKQAVPVAVPEAVAVAVPAEKVTVSGRTRIPRPHPYAVKPRRG